MKYYLTALFDSESYSSIEVIQKSICQKHKIYKNIPALHIILECIEDPDIDKLTKIIGDILKPYKKFKVETNGVISFDPPYKSIKLKIENKGYIIRLARTFNDTLKLHGFNVKENNDNWDLHVTLANINFPSKELSSKDYVAASSNAKREGFFKLATIERIELWKATNNKKDMVVKTFNLRDF